MKVYIIVHAASGEDYIADRAIVEGVFTNRLDAIKCYNKVKNDYRPCDDETNADEGDYPDGWEITNFDEDYHAMVRMIEKEVN